MKRLTAIAAALILIGAAATVAALVARDAGAVSATPAPPSVKVDPFWPKPLPNDWLLGQVAGVAVDSGDDVWIVQRPASLSADERGLENGRSICCRAAPPVIELDGAGNVKQAWGGPARCTPTPGITPVVGGDCYEWPGTEHGLFVDGDGNVWLAGNGAADHQVLKFRPDGRFLLQIGRSGVSLGDTSTQFLGQPAEIDVDTEANEVYVADGYRNHRVIVFDSETGAYKRHWGANGLPPGTPTVQQFGNPVHCVTLSDDGLVYVCDRTRNRTQVFKKDGSFVKELRLAPATAGNGAVWDLDFTPEKEQAHMFVADGENNVLWVQARHTGEVVDRFGRSGRNAGHFHWVHNVVTDSKGNVYTSEVDHGKRVQKFVPTGQRTGQ